MEALESIVNPRTRGHPMKVFLWSSKSFRNIEAALKEKDYSVSYVTFRDLLNSLCYSLQADKKTAEGCKDPDGNEKFEATNKSVTGFMADNSPVMSVDL
mgnify:CR=1 FL=1